MIEQELPPHIKMLADAIEAQEASVLIKVQFGLEQQGHIPTIEKMLNEFGSARSEYIWQRIGQAIGWDYKTAAFYYVEYLRSKNKNQ